MCLSAEGLRMTDVKQQITVQKGNKQNNKWESVRERETSLATQPWEFIIPFVCHLHAKFPCLPSTEFPLAMSAL